MSTKLCTTISALEKSERRSVETRDKETVIFFKRTIWDIIRSPK